MPSEEVLIPSVWCSQRYKCKNSITLPVFTLLAGLQVGKGVVPERSLLKKYPALWMPMIETADIVASRYNISRERQDLYSLGAY